MRLEYGAVTILLALAVFGISGPQAHAASSIQLKITTYSDAGLTTPSFLVATGGALYVDVSLVDQSGHPVVWNCPSLQASLDAPGASLSATTAYIFTGHSDTGSSFGPVGYNAPSNSGARDIDANAPQIGGAEARANVVPPNALNN